MTCAKCKTEFRSRSLTIDGGKTKVSVERCDCGWARFVEDMRAKGYDGEVTREEEHGNHDSATR